MRPTRRLLLALGATAAVVPLAAQQPIPAPGLPGKAAPKPAAPARDGFDNLSFPDEGEARDARQAFEALLEYMGDRAGKDVPWDKVCFLAQERLLDLRSDYFFKPKDAPGSPHVSIKARTAQVLGTLPREGRQFYQLKYGPAAKALLDEASKGGAYDRAKLTDVAQRYFHTQAGGEAALLLAGMDLLTGNYPEAAFAFERLLSRPESDDLMTPQALLKAALALKRAGEGAHAAAAAKAWERLEQKFPRQGLKLGRKVYALEELRDEFSRPVELLSPRLSDELVAMRYGNPSHTGRGAGGTPFLDASFKVPMLYRTTGDDKAGADWIDKQVREVLRKGVDSSKGHVALPGFFPVSTQDLIIFRTYEEVYAVAARDGVEMQGKAFRAGEMVWRSSGGKRGLQYLMSDSEGTGEQAQVADWWRSWQGNHPTLLFENAQVGSLSHDGRKVYFVDDLGLPPPPQTVNPNMGGFPGRGVVDQAQGAHAELRVKIEQSRLVALDLPTGKLEWAVGGAAANNPTEEDRPSTAAKLFEGALFLGPPLPVHGKLYVLFERSQQLRLACLDPHRVTHETAAAEGANRDWPELLWVQKLGSPNQRLTQEPLRRVQPAYLAYADGVLVCPTNSGAVIAVDVNARTLLWARGYASATPPPDETAPRRFNRAGVMFGAPSNTGPLPNDRWRAAAPAIINGRVIVAAHDSAMIQCLDLRTGEQLWADDRKDDRKDDLYVGGVTEDRVIVVGKTETRGYELSGRDGRPEIAWKRPTGKPVGHGALSRDGVFYLPMMGEPENRDGKEAQVWAIDTSNGGVRAKTPLRRGRDDADDPRLALGNLIFHDGQMVSQSPLGVSAFPLLELKRREMERRLAANPNDPDGLAARGEMKLDAGFVREAVADFKRAEATGPSDPVRRKLRQKLYRAYTELLLDDFAANESLLPEYEALCEVPVDSDDPAERDRQIDEQSRRRADRLRLVARGREKQGKLVEAFRAYREYAALGASRPPAPSEGDPNRLTRPDVWACGRIEAMVRGADPSARAPLEEQVRADWEAVKAANDLGRHRDFVRVFAPFFAAGEEAQLLLAQRLAATNAAADAREAQLLLWQLGESSEYPATRAQAVDALAQLLAKRGLMEDAVGLYGSLGTKYAEVAVRGAKTGAEVYGELITDRRLLPFMEAPAGAAAGRYRVEGARGPVQYRPPGYAVLPEGELLPFFRRFRLTMEPGPNGGNSWALRVVDRATGEEYHKFPDLAAAFAGVFAGANSLAARTAQARGHILLLHSGAYAYCFDLAEKRELWRYDLFESGGVPSGEQPQVESDAGETRIRYADGWTMSVGRSAVLQPGYVALLTRNGVVGVHPLTGQKLWEQKDVSPRSQLFGDARHVFLVERDERGGQAKSRVLRASDGAPFPAPDFAGAYTASGRLAVLGRTILSAVPAPAGSGAPHAGLRLIDALTGVDVWKRDFPKGGAALRTLDPDLAGYVGTDGHFVIVSSRTGEVLCEGDATDHLPPDAKNRRVDLNDPTLIADGERFYLFLGRASSGYVSQSSGSVRTQRVNGPAYAYDRVSGRQLWNSERLFDNQAVVVDRFEELPALVLAATVADELGRVEHRVAVVDKQGGRLRFIERGSSGAPFQTIFTDPKTRAVELWHNGYKLRIVPDDEARP